MKALQLFGTDFELISNFMKNRNRNQIKSKYKKESKLNSIRIDHAIWNRIPLSKDAYEDYIKAFKEL
jgi:Transcription initiation factor TFIIIB, Bdp1 subunit